MGQNREVIIEDCKRYDGKTIRVNDNGKPVYIHSKYDPAAEAVQLTEGLSLGEDTVYFVFGIGMGHHIRSLLARMGQLNKIVAFEPIAEVFELFKSEDKNADLLNDERVTLLKFDGIHQMDDAVVSYYELATSLLRNLPFVLPVYAKLCPNEVKEFAECIKNKENFCLLLRNTDKLFSDIWFRCLVDNIGFLRRSHNGGALINLYAGIPAIIVSAGPSLAKNIGLLESARGKAVIISVDTAYKALYNRGIAADFVVSVDAQGFVVNKVLGTDFGERDLITSYMSATTIQQNHTGRIAAIGQEHVFLDACFKDLGIKLPEFGQGGSVACVALEIAFKMGASPIIFVGQDLAQTDNKSHIEGSSYYKEGDTAIKNAFYVKGSVTDKVLTLYNLNLYKQWIELFISKTDGTDYIDATEGGALIDGTAVMPLAEALHKHCGITHDIEERKKRVFSDKNKTVNNEQFAGFIAHFENACNYLNSIVKDVDTAIPAVERIISEIERHGLSRPAKIVLPFEKIKKLNNSLDKNEHHVDIILALMAMEREEAAEATHTMNKQMTEEQALILDLNKYLKYYTALSEKIKYAVPIIEEAVKKEKMSWRVENA